ncbi:MAG: SDR family NAD(P)-dependent oxidoreductase [Polyangiaceae bacterium]
MPERKVAVVLGVGPGLGAAVARRFARGGYALGLMARGTETLAATEAEIERAGGTAISVAVDATDATSVSAGFERVREQLGAPEVLVYNAAGFQMGGILDLTPAMFEDSWRLNCMGAFLAAQIVVPPMRKKAKGTILFTGATASLRGSARFSAFAVGKFGLRALAQSIARELGPEGIHVAHVVIDGQINTPRFRASAPTRPVETALSPDAIAETYWQLHAQDRTAWTFELDLRPAFESF